MMKRRLFLLTVGTILITNETFEKVGNLPWNLPTNDKEITTIPGDLIIVSEQ